MKKATIIVFLLLLFPLITSGQDLRFNVGINKNVGFHNTGIEFYQKYSESLLEYKLDGRNFDMKIELDIYNVKFNYNFKHGNYSGYIWDTDYVLNMMTDRIRAWGESYSNLHLIELGYIFKYKYVDIGLFLSQFWMKLEHEITNGNIYISNGWYHDKPLYGLHSIYTDKNSGYGAGIEIDVWKFKSNFNYFHRVKNSGKGWWNLRNMSWSIYDYLDYYKGDIKFIGLKTKFFDVYLNYSIDVFHSIGGKWNEGETIIKGESIEFNNSFNKNTKFYHGIGFGIALKI